MSKKTDRPLPTLAEAQQMLPVITSKNHSMLARREIEALWVLARAALEVPEGRMLGMIAAEELVLGHLQAEVNNARALVRKVPLHAPRELYDHRFAQFTAALKALDDAKTAFEDAHKLR